MKKQTMKFNDDASESNPLNIIKHALKQSRATSGLRHRGVICLNTVRDDGFPNGRFIDLKDVTNEGLVFCSDFESAKAKDMKNNPVISLTAWWEHITLQIRVIGTASRMEDKVSDRYWHERSNSARLTSWVSRQSSRLLPGDDLLEKFAALKHEKAGQDIPRPPTWGACVCKPVEIETLSFEESRLHIRTLFKRVNRDWQKEYLQP